MLRNRSHDPRAVVQTASLNALLHGSYMGIRGLMCFSLIRVSIGSKFDLLSNANDTYKTVIQGTRLKSRGAQGKKHTARRTTTGVARLRRLLVASFAKVVCACMYDNSALK